MPATPASNKFVPNVASQLHHGGDLYMMKVKDVPNADLGVGYAVNTTWDVEWVRIDDPLAQEESTYEQGAAKGGARFRRLEGAWWGDRTLTKDYNAAVKAGDYRGSEWAGACYSPDGRWLFVNIQTRASPSPSPARGAAVRSKATETRRHGDFDLRALFSLWPDRSSVCCQ